MSDWDVVDITSGKTSGWETSDIEGEKIGEYNVTLVNTEKVVDTNPNLYLQRAEQKLKEGKYDEAVKEGELAVKYSNNNSEVVHEFNLIKTAVDKYKQNKIKARKEIELQRAREIKRKANNYMSYARMCYVNENYDKCIESASEALGYVSEQSARQEMLDLIERAKEKQNQKIEEEKKLNHHIISAKNYIIDKEFDKAMIEADKALKFARKESVKREILDLKRIIVIKKNEIISKQLISKAYGAILNKRYDEAIQYAEDAVKYSDDDIFRNEKNKIIVNVNNMKAQEKGNIIIKKVEQLITQKRYYEALNELENLLKVTKGHKCHDEFIEVDESFKEKIMQIPKEYKENIADRYYNDGRVDKAIEWFEHSGTASSYYKLGKIFIYEQHNVNKGIEYLNISADKNNIKAIIELMNLNLNKEYIKRNLNKAREYYKKLKKADKRVAKAALKKFKKEYNLSLYKLLRIKGKVKVTIFSALIILFMFAAGSSFMFISGRWKGIVIDSSITLEKEIVGLDKEINCNTEVKVLPFFAKYPEKSVNVEDDSIAVIENGKIRGISEGSTNIVLYVDGKEINRSLIKVCKMGIDSFKIHYDNDLINVGDSIEPEIEITYLNDIKIDNVDILYTSSNEDVVKVVDNKKLVALKEGKAEVIVKVNDKEKKLIFNIIDPYKKKNATANVLYKNYKDELFGYSIDIPQIFDSISKSSNGRTICCDNYKEGIRLIIGGEYNTLHESVESRYENCLRNLSNVDYKFINESEYVISYTVNGYSYYFNEIVGSKSINGFSMMCRVEDVDKYSPIIERLYSSFKAPYVNNIYR